MHQILYRTGHQNLARAGKSSNACADVNRDAADVVADHFALAGVKPGTNFNAERPDFVSDGACAANPACRAVERGKKPIAGRFHLMAPKAHEVPPAGALFMLTNIPPPLSPH